MSNNEKTIQNALPLNGVDANGLFNPTNNVQPNKFNAPSSSTDSPYNTVYIGDTVDTLVGSETVPYLPMALPAYIPTLYENIFHIQTNLKQKIEDTIVNEREYPTTIAVKSYVQSQLSGRETLTPSSTGEVTISTVLTTSFLKASKTQGLNVGVRTNTEGKTVYTTTYNINKIDTARDGSEKLCINISPLGAGTDPNNPDDIYNLQILLEDKQEFIVYGKSYKCYVPGCLGDGLKMVQYIKDDKDIFYVLSYGGVFKNEVFYTS